MKSTLNIEHDEKQNPISGTCSLCQEKMPKLLMEQPSADILHIWFATGSGINAIQAAEHHVENSDVGKKRGCRLYGGFTGMRRDGFESSCLQNTNERVGDGGLVVYDENPLT